MSDIDLVQLMDTYLDGQPTADELDALQAWLHESDDNVKVFVGYANLHANLRRHLTIQDIRDLRTQVLGSDNPIASDLTEVLDAEDQDADASGKGPIPIKDANRTEDKETRPIRPSDNHSDLDRKNHRLVFHAPGIRVYRTDNDGDHRPPRVLAKLRPYLVAASIVVVFALAAIVLTEQRDPAAHAAQPLAAITGTHQAIWSTHSHTQDVGELLLPGRYGLTSGYAELLMNNDAVVLLEGPCEFELLDDDAIHLHRGRATARVHEPADGLTIMTPTARVIDLGTKFGVQVEGSGHTLAAVFDGHVMLTESSGGTETGREDSVELTAGRQAYVDAACRLLPYTQPITHDHEFTLTLELARNTPKLEGDIRLYRIAPDSVDVGDLVTSDNAIVFLESHGVRLDKSLTDMMTGPGEYEGPSSVMAADGIVPAGTVVDSYLIHYDVTEHLDDLKKNTTEYSVEGAIRFPRPVVAVIGRPRHLMETDAIFAHPTTRYVHHPADDPFAGAAAARGIRDAGDGDLIEIMPDRRTVRFRLTVTTLDQFRVLIESE